MVGIKKLAKENIFHLLILVFTGAIVLYQYKVEPLENERIYLRTIFPFFREAYDYSFGKLPFAFVYLLFGIVLLWFAKGAFDIVKFVRQRKFVTPILRFISSVCWVYASFYFLWGLNYKNRPLQYQLNLPDINVDSTMVYEEAAHLIGVINEMRDSLSSDTCHLDITLYSDSTEDTIRQSLVSLLESWYLPHEGRVRVRTLAPKGILLRISTAGVYIPYAMEGHIDAGLPKLQWPFVMAHEMSHGYGITDEGECNFVATLACANSNDPYIQYSGLLAYWRYMANSLIRVAPGLGMNLVKMRSPSVKNDSETIINLLNSYPDIMPKVRNKVYDTYLKSNGVAAGAESYGTIINLMQRWKASSHNRPLFEKLYGVKEP